ncbi:MAG: hypothetical protein QG632_5 [Candidatus Dependentiae bacterium]|nr:hypothetical protein [Candidatus Dependentiae bacterium]
METHSTSLTALLKAQKNFEAYRQNLDTDQNKAGAIQAFEYSFELAWKGMKRIIEDSNGKPIFGMKEIFRTAALAGLIDEPEIWFVFLEQRNLTSHTYDEEVAEEIIEIFPRFSVELEAFINKATKRIQNASH